jgi:predicted dienelactone hydrolase
MIASDWVMFGALVAFVLVLLWPGVKLRALLALTAALIAAAAGGWSLLQGMWQSVPALVLAALCALGALIALVWKRRAPTNGAKPWTALVVGVLALATAAPYYFAPIPTLPQPTGPHAVGTLSFQMTDQSRRGVLDDAPGVARRIYVRAWYPARVPEGASARAYFTPWEAANTARSVATNWGFPVFSLSHLRHLRTHSFDNAPIETQAGGYPVVIYSHGYWGGVQQNTALMEELASRGYIVFSLAHPYDAGDILFDDGVEIATTPPDFSGVGEGMMAFWNAIDHDTRWAAFPGYKREADAHRIIQSFDAWRADARFLLANLQAGTPPNSVQPLLQSADLSRLAFGGMSFGGTMAASLCETEPTCVAAANIDGEEFDWQLYDHEVRMPLLVLYSDWARYSSFPQPEAPFYQNDYAYERLGEVGLSDHVYRVWINGLQHVGLSDLILGARGPVREHYFGTIDGAEAVATINSFTADFFDEQLKGQDTGFPEAQLQAHPDAVRHDVSGVRDWWRSTQPEAAAATP